MPDLAAKTHEICRLLEIKPARSKGQNFLINDKIYDGIIAAADLQPTDTVLEIGPGLGFLTAKLAKKVRRVIAVELDDKLAAYLQTGIDAADLDNVTVVNEDILKFNLAAHLATAEKYKIVANLPYNITSIFLRQFLSVDRRPVSLVLMLQKEVAERICAAPPEMSILAVSIQYYAVPKIIREVKAGNFWPEPEVDSAIIRLDVHDRTAAKDGSASHVGESAENKKFFQMIKFGFSSKRKMLKNNLAAGLRIKSDTMAALLVKQGFPVGIRAEALSVEDWRKLFAALRTFMV
jgi:16S rRNA (adenine1518-N6/adenine1519-N6)-dimethyltransferase